MPDAAHFRKGEADARFMPLAPTDAAFRVSDSGGGVFLQLRDQADEKFRSIWLNAGVPQAGPAED